MSPDVMPILMDASIRAVLLVALVWVLLTICRVRDARVQHGSWTIVVAGMLTMPMLSALLPTVSVPLRPALAEGTPIEMRDPALEVSPRVGAVYGPLSQDPLVEQRSLTAIGMVPRVASNAPRSEGSSRVIRWSAWLTGLYLLVAALMLLRTAIGWRRASRLVRDAAPVTVPFESGPVLESASVVVPVTIGVFRPTIVVPVSWRSWPDAKLRAVLGHEGAHVDRWDPFVAFVARLNVCLFWFHPVAWWLERTVSRTAELACDEAGAQVVGDRRQYVEIVTQIAGEASRHGGRMTWVAANIGAGHLAARIHHLSRAPIPRASAKGRFAAAAACVVLVATVAACRLDGVPSISEERAAELEWHYSDETAVREQDRPDYEAMLLKSKAENPEGPWSARLGRFYAATMIGQNVQIRTSESRARTQEITGADWNSSSAKRAREILAATSDSDMLSAAGEYLWSGATIRPMRAYSLSFETIQALDKEREALLLSYLERAVALDPELVSARSVLFAVRERSRSSRFYWEWRDVPVSSQYEFIAALGERERFERLPYAAQSAWSSFQSNNGLSQYRNDRNLDEFRQIREEQVVKYLGRSPRACAEIRGSPRLRERDVQGAHAVCVACDVSRGRAFRRRARANCLRGLSLGRVDVWQVRRVLAGLESPH